MVAESGQEAMCTNSSRDGGVPVSFQQSLSQCAPDMLTILWQFFEVLDQWDRQSGVR